MKTIDKSSSNDCHGRTNRTLTCILSALVWVVALPGAARADIVYTWHEDDGKAVSGSLVVASSAQAAGEILLTDVISFSWQGVFGSYSGLNTTYGFTPIPISESTAAFTSPNLYGDAIFSGVITGPQSDQHYAAAYTNSIDMLPGQGAAGERDGEQIVSESGHWTVSGATVPEPSSLVMAALAVVSGLGLSFRYCRRTANG